MILINKRKSLYIKIIVAFVIACVVFVISPNTFKRVVYRRVAAILKIENKSLTNTINNLEPLVEEKLRLYFEDAGVSYLPTQLTFLAFKEEKILELWAEEENKWHYIKSYPVFAASGQLGPKLKEGDRQVPEGIYNIIGMNPQSYYHLAMLIDYPNSFDKEKAKLEGRKNLGGDICIHGKAVSIGCLAMGDKVIEELFYLTGKIGMQNVNVVISPYDFRVKDLPQKNSIGPVWMDEVYEQLETELNKYNKKFELKLYN